MSDYDKNIQEALAGDSGFDPSRVRAAQTEVYQAFQKKMKWSERGNWLVSYLYCAIGVYALWGFILQATTTKEFVGYGMVIMATVAIVIQFNVLFAIAQSKLVTLKETKQVRLALAGGATLADETDFGPLRGLSRREKVVWFCGVIAVIGIVGGLSNLSNRQDDLWRLKANGQIEAHTVLTLHRFPHKISSFYSVMGPVEGAVLESATLNGAPVAFDNFEALYNIRLPYRTSWKKDKIELAWGFALPAEQDISDFRVPLQSLVPVHSYSLTLYVEDDSRYVATEDLWKFNKTPEELKNATEARRTIKCFTQDIRRGAPRKDFGSCSLPIIARPQ